MVASEPEQGQVILGRPIDLNPSSCGEGTRATQNADWDLNSLGSEQIVASELEQERELLESRLRLNPSSCGERSGAAANTHENLHAREPEHIEQWWQASPSKAENCWEVSLA